MVITRMNPSRNTTLRPSVGSVNLAHTVAADEDAEGEEPTEVVANGKDFAYLFGDTVMTGVGWVL